MKLKICGIKSLDDINLMNEFNPDFIGFIFFDKSTRYIDFYQAKKLKDQLKKSIKAVGVFVNEDLNKIIQGYNNKIYDIVQLHGDEDQAQIDQLKKLGIPVIKAIKVESSKDILKTNFYNPDWFLFDVKDNKLVGGTGRSFNWEYLKNYSKDIPYFLAGGINPSNIVDTFKTKAEVVDVSSGVEINNKKNKNLVKELFKAFQN